MQQAFNGAAALAIAHAHAEAALESAADDASALARVYGLLSILARGQGRIDEALSAARHSRELADQVEHDPALVVAAGNVLALALAESGDSVHAVKEVQRALNLCRRIGDRHHAAARHNNLADFYHELGEEEQAMAHLTRAVALFAAIGEAVANKGRERQPEIWMLSEWVL